MIDIPLGIFGTCASSNGKETSRTLDSGHPHNCSPAGLNVPLCWQRDFQYAQSVGWLNIKTVDRYDIPDKADLDVLRALYDAAATGRLGANSRANCTIFGQTPEIDIQRDALKSNTDEDLNEVAPEGIEPPTNGLGNRCSILLSYGATP